MKSKIVTLCLLVSSGAFATTTVVPHLPFKATDSIPMDATPVTGKNFAVKNISVTKMPFAVVENMADVCLEGPATCFSSHGTNYQPVIHVHVDYKSDQEMSSMEFKSDNKIWGSDFYLPVTAAAALQVALLPQNKRLAAANALISLEATTTEYDVVVLTKVCERDLVGETDWRIHDSNCSDEYGIGKSYGRLLNLALKQ